MSLRRVIARLTIGAGRAQPEASPPARLGPAPRPPAGQPAPNVQSRKGQRRSDPHPAFGEEALHRAWRQVRANGGGAGVDGIDIRAFEADLEGQLASLRQELLSGSYQPRAVRRVLVPKRNEGLRPLAVWALRDRVAQRAVYNAIEPAFEPHFLDCSHGFRPGRSVQTAVDQVLAARDAGLRWVLDADIKDCFESIDPALLLKMVRSKIRDKTLLRLLEGWLQAHILNAAGQSKAAGAGQGGVLSPLLSNIYLHRLDVALTGQGYRLVRYADDLVVLCRKRQQALAAAQATEKALAGLRLEIHPQKTQVVHFDQGFKFLGVFFLRQEYFYL